MENNKYVFLADNLFNSKKNKIIKINPSKIKNLNFFPKFYALLIKNKISTVTHMADFDGIGSAAILIKTYGKNIENLFFIDYKKKEVQNLKSKMQNLKNSIIIILDIGMNEDLLPDFIEIFAHLKKNKNTIIWLDHHEWSNNSVQKISERIDFLICKENKINCATELAYSLLCKKDKFGDNLADIIHIGDFNLRARQKSRQEIIIKMAYVINNICSNKNRDINLKKLANYIAGQELENEFINNAYKKYLKASKLNLKILNKTISTFNVKNYKFAIGFSKNLQASFACSYILDKTKSDLSIFYNSATNVFHLRSRGPECILIAKAMHGGGHPHAAAFESAGKQIDLNNIIEIKKAVDQIKNIAEKIY